MRNLTAVALAFATAIVPSVAAARAKVYGSKHNRPITAPSSAAPADIAADFVRARGKSGLTMDSVRATETPGQHNLTFVRMEQVVDGLRVHGAYARAAVNERGELVHVIDNLVPVTGSVKRAAVSEKQALAAALRHLGHDSAAGPGYFHKQPTVERVIVQRGGGLAQGFLVVTWTEEKNVLHHTLVGPDGAIDDVELRTNSDSYRVFSHSPEESQQTVVQGNNWLSGAQSTGLIVGPNARAYLDADRRQNQPDNFGVAAGSDFLATWNPNEAANSTNNRTVAIQNLFYQNNLLHDTLYAAGFTEARGNFQGNDPVNAEAQDGGGTDNANFATPADGSSPRMQMYLWTGGFQVRVDTAVGDPIGPFFASHGSFSAKPTFTGESGGLAYRGDGCSAVTGVSGLVVLVDRGTCDFILKAKNVASAGGRAVIVANNTPESPDAVPLMGGSGKVKIEAVAVSYATGSALKDKLNQGAVNVTVRAADPAPGYRDGDLDSDIIWHEYGHGLTWRMIGGMSGVFSGAIGEGMSDVLALTHGTDDRMAEYSASNPIGIRRAAYDSYPNTYGSMNTGTRQVHNDGEIYGAIGWRMIQAYDGAGLTRAELLADLVFGMTFTPSQPKMEDMRDGILDGLVNSGHTERACMVWNAFAEYGVGVGAAGTVLTSSTVSVVEKFEVPAECQ